MGYPALGVLDVTLLLNERLSTLNALSVMVIGFRV
jgi:hypothetical protein